MVAIRLAAGGWLALCGVAVAQEAGSGAIRDTVPLLKAGSPLIVWGVAAAFLIGCLAIAFKNSKRSSQG